jgi:hypothetical protein
MALLDIIRPKQPPAQHVPLETTVEGMLGWMATQGELTLTILNGKWWCYFQIKKGAMSIEIKGDRQDGWSIYEAVADCYHKVRKAAGL